MDIQKNVSLKKFNSWKTGGLADFFCEPECLEDLIFALKWAKEQNLPVTALGGGTNILVSDQGVEGLVLSSKKLDKIKHYIKKDRLYILALAGVPKAQLFQIFLKYKLAPALFLCGLPGNTAGGVVMNAGIGDTDIVPREFGEIVDEVRVVKKEKLLSFFKKDLTWDYRSGFSPQSSQGENSLIYEVIMSWPNAPAEDLPHQVKQIALKRSKSQPLQSASSGSVFKNPPPPSAGAGFLIEKCGLKGQYEGTAVVSDKHANFIINSGGAKAEDIHKLIVFIQKQVEKKYNILLEPEVKYIGRWSYSGKG